MSEEINVRGTMNTQNWGKVWRGFLIGFGGVFITYVAEFITTVDFGDYTALIVGAAGLLINFARQWLSGVSQ